MSRHERAGSSPAPTTIHEVSGTFPTTRPLVGRLPPEHPLQLRALLPRHLPSQHRCRDHSSLVEVVHEGLHRELVALLRFLLREHAVELDLADQVARSVTRLL